MRTLLFVTALALASSGVLLAVPSATADCSILGYDHGAGCIGYNGSCDGVGDSQGCIGFQADGYFGWCTNGPSIEDILCLSLAP